MSDKKPVLYLVVPCFNESEVLDKSSRILSNKLIELENYKIISNESKVLFVNDGSTDGTESKLQDLVKSNSKFGVVSFAANAGHQNAIYAGMMVAKDYADMVVTIDADLQQDINAITKFIDAYDEGCDVVYGVRNDRKTDKAFKKTTASIYYKIMKFLGSNVLENSADYRLLSKKALNCLSEYKESNLFLRGLIPSMGLNSGVVYFDVKDREAGESKYTFKKMLNLAVAGLTSSSTTPIHLICAFGGALVVVGLLLLLVDLFILIFTTSSSNLLLYSLLFIMFGITIGCIGLVGEYVGIINQEVKNRPRYNIDYVLIKTKEKNDKKHSK